MLGCIIQARMGSTRFPGKVLENLDDTNPSLQYTINQLKASKLLKRIVIATTKESKDDQIEIFAEKSGIDRGDVIAMERHPGYKPSPLVIHRLSKFYDIPQKKLAFLAGAIKDLPPEVEAEASRFAAQSESFSKLTEGAE